MLSFQDKSLVDFLGADEAKAAEVMLKATVDDAVKSVQKQINAHAEVWKVKEQSERDKLLAAATVQAAPWIGHVIKCPACSSPALLTGEEVRQQPPILENDKLVVRSVVLPNELECTACGLRVKGHSQLHAAGFGGQFTNVTRYDPLDYYGVGYPGGEEFNNE